MSDRDEALFILLGASNLSRVYAGLAEHLRESLHPRPVQFLNALGPGRGVVRIGGLWNISYPAFRASGIFEVAREKAKSAREIVALVTDIGNDIMYGVPAEVIIAELDRVFRELAAMKARIFATPIPGFLEKPMNDKFFHLLRAWLYPNSKLEQHQIVAVVREINNFLHKTAANGGGVSMITGLEDCYAPTKIHYAPHKTGEAWSRIAREMLRPLGIEAPQPLGWRRELRGFRDHFTRLYFSDLLPWRKKSAEFF